MSPSSLPFIWDDKIDGSQSRRLRDGSLNPGRLDRRWAAVTRRCPRKQENKYPAALASLCPKAPVRYARTTARRRRLVRPVTLQGDLRWLETG